MNKALLLGVNIDHIATVRQARGTGYPSPVHAAMAAEQAGADGITLHLREDKRHIQPEDVRLIKAVLETRMNLEMAVTEEMLRFADTVAPEHVCFVPEKREEVTTEGGLDVVEHYESVKRAVERMQQSGSAVSIFIDPDISQIDAAAATGTDAVELHTGSYAEALHAEVQAEELEKIRQAALYAAKLKLTVNAGHGLHYHNVKPIAQIQVLNELNIGHAIVARALFCGLAQAVRSMRALMQEARLL